MRVIEAADTTTAVMPREALDLCLSPSRNATTTTTGNGNGNGTMKSTYITPLNLELVEHLRQAGNLLRDKHCKHREAGRLYTKAMTLLANHMPNDTGNDNDDNDDDVASDDDGEKYKDMERGGSHWHRSWTPHIALIAHDAAINMTFGQFADDS